jgi:hypothetical protein
VEIKDPNGEKYGAIPTVKRGPARKRRNKISKEALL